MQPPLHIGRSHHVCLRYAASLTGGFVASFLAFSLATAVQSSRSLPGQLVAGDPALHRDYPTTLRTVQGTMDAGSAMLSAMGSGSWWAGVTAGALLFTPFVLRMVRRYV